MFKKLRVKLNLMFFNGCQMLRGHKRHIQNEKERESGTVNKNINTERDTYTACVYDVSRLVILHCLFKRKNRKI